jgi:hypothetical protein
VACPTGIRIFQICRKSCRSREASLMRISNADGAAYIGSALVPKLFDRGNIETLKLLSANNGLGSLAEVEAR